MSGRIPQSFIDDLVARVDIAEVIGERVKLRKAGRDFKACCPFHDEKTPSFTVSPTKQFYHCFGCGAHGTVLGFLMDYDRLEFVDAVEELAGRLGVEVPREGGGASDRPAMRHNDGLHEALEAAAGWYQKQLRSHPAAVRAVQYLKGRGLSGEVARDFQIGFAPPGWDGLGKALGAAFAESVLVDAGLSIRKDNGAVYDRFRDRIMFPIRDTRGRTIAFGGRVLDPEQSPKYLNSPETPVFHKSRELYGLWEARGGSRNVDQLLVVEGYMDVVALAQHGIRCAVATLGTAATTDHIERLFRSTARVVFAFDGDSAGRRAASRALETVLPALRDGREVDFLFLPEGEDPDTLVRRIGAEGFLQAVAGATSALAYLLEELATGLRDSPESHGRLVSSAVERLDRIPSAATREVALARLCRTAGMPREQLDSLMSHQQQRAAARTPREKPFAQRPEPAAERTPVRHAIRLLLFFPEAAAGLEEDLVGLSKLERPGMRLLLDMIELLRERPQMAAGVLVEHFRQHPEGRHLPRIAALGQPPGDEKQMAAEFRDVLRSLRGELEEQRFAELRDRARVGSLDDDERREFLDLIARAPGGQRPGGR